MSKSVERSAQPSSFLLWGNDVRTSDAMERTLSSLSRHLLASALGFPDHTSCLLSFGGWLTACRGITAREDSVTQKVGRGDSADDTQLHMPHKCPNNKTVANVHQALTVCLAISQCCEILTTLLL